MVQRLCGLYPLQWKLRRVTNVAIIERVGTVVRVGVSVLYIQE